MFEGYVNADSLFLWLCSDAEGPTIGSPKKGSGVPTSRRKVLVRSRTHSGADLLASHPQEKES